MGYLSIDEFRRGLFGGRLPFSTPQGALLRARNVVINRGGEIEKRKAFVPNVQVSSDTFGLGSDGRSLYTFGSVAAPTMPSGVLYQRLQHPDGAAMTSVHTIELFGGKFYVIADYADGARCHFYDGVYIQDWQAGIVRSAMVSNDGIATHLASVIDAHPDYSATALGNVVTVTGPLGREFTVTTSTTNKAGGSNDQSLTAALTQGAVPVRAAQIAKGSFRIVGGSSNPGNSLVRAVKVNGIDISAGVNVDWTVSNEATAQAIADQINVAVSSPNYTAVVVGDEVQVSASPGTGASANGEMQVRANGNAGTTSTGDVIITEGWFEIVEGTNSPGVNYIQKIEPSGNPADTINVDWVTDNETTAAAVVTAMKAISTNRSAFAVGNRVYIGPRNSLTVDTKTITVTCQGNVKVITSDSGIPATVATYSWNNSVVDVAGGVDAFAGIAQISTLTVGGTFEVGDTYQVIISDPILGDLVFGGGTTAGQVANAAIGLKTKMNVAAGSYVFTSAVADATQFAFGTGASFIQAADHARGIFNIVGLGIFQNRLVAAGRNATAIFNYDPDPDLTTLAQTLDNFGTIARRSMGSHGTKDLLMLSDSGVRSVRQMTGVDFGESFDVGTPIDDLVVAAIESDLAGAEEAHHVFDPQSNRFWLYLNGQIYVLTFFENGAIAAWTIFDNVPAFTHMVAHEGQVWCRAGTQIYVYGGLDKRTYDESEAEVELAYIDARRIATWKSWTGLDVAISGLWQVYANTDPNRSDRDVLLMNYHKTTFAMLANNIASIGPAIKLRLVSTAAERAVFSQLALHYSELGAG